VKTVAKIFVSCLCGIAIVWAAAVVLTACSISIPPATEVAALTGVETFICDEVEVAIALIPVVGAEMGPVEDAYCEQAFAALNADIVTDAGILLAAPRVRIAVRDATGKRIGIATSTEHATRMLGALAARKVAR
jgi:hypothetical protein